MLSQPAIQAGLHTWWRDHLPNDTPTLYPGARADTTPLAAWYELWTDVWHRPARRITNTDAVRIAITVHVFVKGSAHQARLHALADDATATLQHQAIPLHDPASSETPLVGYATLHEATTRNLTRPQQANAGDHLQHAVITIEGTAQAVGSV